MVLPAEGPGRSKAHAGVGGHLGGTVEAVALEESIPVDPCRPLSRCMARSRPQPVSPRSVPTLGFL